MTFWETIERGEYVMFALAVIVIAIVIIWWVRASILHGQRKKYPVLMQRIRDHVVEGDIENSRQICKALSLPGARVVEAGLSRVGQPMGEVKAAMEDASRIEKDHLSRGARLLRAMAVISPLLGLGGTLVGIIDRLRVLGEAGAVVDTAAVCGALAPTIVTTVAGLGVGIFALVALTCLEGSINSAQRNLDELSKEFIDLLNEPT